MIAALDFNHKNYTNFRMDFTQSANYEDQFLVMSEFKIAKTDTTGVATFTQLSVMDVDEYSCISFVFYIGQPYMFTASASSN